MHIIFLGNTGAISMIAALHGIDAQANIDWTRGQIDYMLGANPMGISYQIRESALGGRRRNQQHRGA